MVGEGVVPGLIEIGGLADECRAIRVLEENVARDKQQAALGLHVLDRSKLDTSDAVDVHGPKMRYPSAFGVVPSAWESRLSFYAERVQVRLYPGGRELVHTTSASFSSASSGASCGPNTWPAFPRP